jgi:hypothetical protein
MAGGPAGDSERGKLSPEQAKRLLQQAADKIEVNPASFDLILSRIAERRRRHRVAWWSGGATVIAAAAAVLVLSMLATSGHTKLSVSPGPPSALQQIMPGTPRVVTTPASTPDASPTLSMPSPSLPTSTTAVTTATTPPPGPTPAAKIASAPIPGAGSDIDGDGIADRVTIVSPTAPGAATGSDIMLQASMSRLGIENVVVHGYTGEGTPSVLGITDAFQTGSAAIFVGTGRNTQPQMGEGTKVATLVVLVGTELQQVQAAPSSPYYVTLNRSINLDTPPSNGATTTTTGPSVFNTSTPATTLISYGCTNGWLYEDRATAGSQSSSPWMVNREFYRLKGASLVLVDTQSFDGLSADAAKAKLAADRCGPVNEAGSSSLAGG